MKQDKHIWYQIISSVDVGSIRSRIFLAIDH